jgi:hypothetical protein
MDLHITLRILDAWHWVGLSPMNKISVKQSNINLLHPGVDRKHILAMLWPLQHKIVLPCKLNLGSQLPLPHCSRETLALLKN